MNTNPEAEIIHYSKFCIHLHKNELFLVKMNRECITNISFTIICTLLINYERQIQKPFSSVQKVCLRCSAWKCKETRFYDCLGKRK